jgi:hypothetical protein
VIEFIMKLLFGGAEIVNKFSSRKSSTSKSSTSMEIELDDNNPPQGGSGVPDKPVMLISDEAKTAAGTSMTEAFKKALKDKPVVIVEGTPREIKLDDVVKPEKMVPRYPKKEDPKNYLNPKLIDDNLVSNSDEIRKEEKKRVINKGSTPVAETISKCDNCELKKKDDIEKKKKKAIEEVFKDLSKLSPYEFECEIRKNEGKCVPNSCWGECEGFGDCTVATEFRTRIHPSLYKPILIKKKIKNRKKNNQVKVYHVKRRNHKDKRYSYRRI